MEFKTFLIEEFKKSKASKFKYKGELIQYELMIDDTIIVVNLNYNEPGSQALGSTVYELQFYDKGSGPSVLSYFATTNKGMPFSIIYGLIDSLKKNYRELKANAIEFISFYGTDDRRNKLYKRAFKKNKIEIFPGYYDDGKPFYYFDTEDLMY